MNFYINRLKFNKKTYEAEKCYNSFEKNFDLDLLITFDNEDNNKMIDEEDNKKLNEINEKL